MPLAAHAIVNLIVIIFGVPEVNSQILFVTSPAGVWKLLI